MFYSTGKALTENNALHFLYMILWCIVPFAAISYLVSRNFLKIITTGQGKRTFKYKSTGVRVRTPIASMTRMELERFFSSVTYMINGGMGLIMLVLFSFFVLTGRDTISSMTLGLTMMGLNGDSFSGAILCLAILGIMGMVCISSATISLDANTLWIPKSLPTKGSDVLLSKALPHILVSIPFIIIAVIVSEIGVNMNIADRILLILIPLTANVFNGIMGVRINVRFPKFNWTNEAQAVKQGISVLLVMIFSVLPVLIFILGLYFLCYRLGLSVTMLMLIMELAYIVMALWMYLWAKKKGDICLASLQN